MDSYLIDFNILDKIPYFMIFFGVIGNLVMAELNRVIERYLDNKNMLDILKNIN